MEEKIKITDIKPDPENPRVISEQAESQLSESVKSFGNIAGITYNKRTGQLVSGHQRFNQLKKQFPDLKLKTLNPDFLMITSQDKDTGFLIRVVDWEETKQKAANIVANAPHIAGEFDFPKLNEIKQKYDLSEYETKFHLDGLEELVMPHGITSAGQDEEGDGEETASGDSEFPHKITILCDYDTLCKLKDPIAKLMEEHRDRVKVII